MPNGKEIRTEQRRERRMVFLLNADAVTPTLTLGSPQATLVRNGAGDYTLTFRRAFGRAPIAIVVGDEDNAMGRQGTRAVGSIQILIEDASSNVAADLDVLVEVIGWDSLDEV